MSELLDRALRELAKLSPERQDELAAMLLDLMVQESGEFELTPDQEAALKEAIARADRGKFASDAEVDALYRKYGA